jgi:hypothetical protein
MPKSNLFPEALFDVAGKSFTPVEFSDQPAANEIKTANSVSQEGRTYSSWISITLIQPGSARKDSFSVTTYTTDVSSLQTRDNYSARRGRMTNRS